MPRKLAIDRTIFVTVLMLCMTGLVMVYSASAVIASEQHGNPYHFLIRQILGLGVGLCAMIVMMKTDYRMLRSGPVVYTLFGATVLLLVAALMSPAVNGAHRWIILGPLSLQPSEFAKLTLIVFLAWRLQRAPDEVNNVYKTVIPCLVLSGFFIFLVLKQPDLGTAISLGLCVAVMFFAAGVRSKYLVLMALVAVVAGGILLKDYQIDRVFTFFNPDADPLGAGYHVNQSTISVGAGGELGRGLGEGQQKLFFLPYPYTDFIYAVIGEELGLLGTGTVTLAFLVFLWRGLKVSARAPDLFGSYLAIGVTMFIVMQAMINMGVTLGMLPAKGLPLPFVSYGGSSLVAALMASGVLLNISQYAK
jgi:cell division protein FtsW